MERTIFNNYDGYSYKDAEQYCIERHLEDYPEDTEWEPSDNEVYEEIESNYEFAWDDVSSELKSFFDDGDTFVLTGTAGTWRGRMAGGAIIHNYNELSKAWANRDYVVIKDTNGKFSIDATHHDGTDYWEVRKLTKRGLDYLNKHEYDDPEELHSKLASKGYSVNLHYCKNVWGC